MKPEKMTIGTKFGVIKVTLCAKDSSGMAALRDVLFNWYEDLAECETLFDGAVSIRHTSDQKISAPSVIPPEVDVDSACQIMNKLKNLLDTYIVLKSMSSLCGEVVQIPIRHDEYEKIIADTRMFLDHVIQRYMGGYPF